MIMIRNATQKGYLEANDGDGIDISTRMEHHRGTVQKEKSQTITTMGGENIGVVVKENIPNKINETNVIGGIGEKDSNNNTQWKYQNRVYSSSSSPAVFTAFNPNFNDDLRIRKLTPKECFRLMGLKDEDIELISIGQTNSALYHLAGDSIVTTCLMAIYSELFGINWEDKFNSKEWWNNDNNKE